MPIVHTADTDKTRLSCLVLSAVWTEFATVADSFQYIGDRTVLCCLRCERIWEQDKTQFTPHFETGQNCFEIFSRRQSWLVSNSVHTANTGKTRQDSLVLSVFAVWTSHRPNETVRITEDRHWWHRVTLTAKAIEPSRMTTLWRRWQVAMLFLETDDNVGSLLIAQSRSISYG